MRRLVLRCLFAQQDSPITYDYPFETPLLPQNFLKKLRVFGTVNTFDAAVPIKYQRLTNA